MNTVLGFPREAEPTGQILDTGVEEEIYYGDYLMEAGISHDAIICVPSGEAGK